jgi:hypothetical protein
MLPRLPSILLCFLFFLPLAVFPQYFTVGTDPASVKWRHLKSDHFRIIYPRGMDSTARYVANAFELNFPMAAKGLESRTGKWPVILHNQSIVSNAFTPYAPKRIEFLTTPPQDIYPQPWLDQLVIHEYRHSVQYGSVNRGFSKALSYVFGQQVTAGVLGLFVPMWFIEGDATAQETAMSESGRGRSPSFEKGLRAQFLEKGIYSYDKAYNGSFKDYVPDWYELGYQLVAYTRINYGMDAWKPVMERVGKYPFMVVPFSSALHKQTGMGKSRLYRKAADYLKTGWKWQAAKSVYTNFERISKPAEKNYTQYDEPVFLSDSVIIIDKVSIDDVNRYVLIDFEGNEKIILTPGLGMLDDALSAAGGLICWAEQNPDPRWTLRNYGVLNIYDMATGKQRQLTHRTKFFAPILSGDGSRILVSEVAPDGRNSLVIVSSKTGEVLNRITSPENYFFAQPNWSPDDRLVVSVVLGKNGKSLVIADPGSGRMRNIIPFGYKDIGEPVFYDRYILFRASYSGIDDIYAADTLTAEIFRVTSSRFGASGPVVSPDSKKLVYSSYSSMGNELVWAPLDSSTWQPLSEVHDYSLKLYEPLTSQMNYIFDPDSVKDADHLSKPYRKGLHLFNFHSWAPVTVDIYNMDINPGVTLLSQNLLGTSTTRLGYQYNLNDETGKYFVNYSYEGLYPAFDVSTDYGLRKGAHTDSAGTVTKYRYHELNLAAGVRVPLNWYARSWYMGIQPFAGYSLKYLKLEPGTDLHFLHDRIQSLDYHLLFYAQIRQSYRDLMPKWGQTVQLDYRDTPFGNDPKNSIFAAQAVLYFPGLFRHHGLKVYCGYQERVASYYEYGSIVNMPRGYSGIDADRILSGSLYYEFPVFYPDWHIGPVIYMKRLKAAVFYDQAWDYDNKPYHSYNSAGVDLKVDFHLARHFAPLGAGLRTIYFPQNGTFGFEFLYSFNLAGIY